MTTPYTKIVRARDLPEDWRQEAALAPDERVEVVVTPLPDAGERSPRSFLGAGKGLFRSAAEVDAYIRRLRDEWGS
jgi:hypothetical protein